MFNWFIDLCSSDKIEIFSILASLVTSIVAIIVSIKTLKQSNNAIVESSRANIMFYIDIATGNQTFLVLKNFGSSSGKILDIDISPNIQYSKLKDSSSGSVITEFTNLTLAPSQCIKSWFDFSNYPDKIFNVKLKYETLGKIYNEEYTLNISYMDSIDYLSAYSIDVASEKDALVKISNNLLRINEKL